MDPHDVKELLEIVLFIIGTAVVAYSPIPRAIGQRILHGKVPPPGSLLQDDGRVDDLSSEVRALRQVVEEQQERLDFTERVISQGKARDALPGAR